MSSVNAFSTIRHEIAGLPVHELADRFGTPTYLYDSTSLLERVADLQSFDVIRYAQKANSNLAILKLLRERGVLVDAVSAGEIKRAFAAGYQPQGEPPPIVYTADLFTHEALDLVVEHHIHVNCGSPDMIDQLGERAPGRDITLRINPGFGHGHSQKTNTGGDQSKHGIWHTDVADCLERVDRHGLTVTGLHMHIGSGTDFEHLAQVCEAMERIASEVGRTVTSISAGGGLPIPYNDEQNYIDVPRYFELWHQTRQRLESQFGHSISLEVEPGRFIAAESGYLITEVRAIKQMGENPFYIVDAGFNTLARPVMYGAYHPMALAPRSGRDDLPHREVVVGGPLCESGDIFTQEEGGYVCRRSLPQAQVGDLLILGCAGAYGFVMASNYNTQPLPAEVLIHEGSAHIVRKRQTVDEILGLESMME